MPSANRASLLHSKKGKGKAATEEVEDGEEEVEEKRKTPNKKKPGLLDKISTPFKRKKVEAVIEIDDAEDTPSFSPGPTMTRPRALTPSITSSKSFPASDVFDSYSQVSGSHASMMPPLSQSSFSSHRSFMDRDRTID